MIYLLLILVIVLFVTGVSFIYHGYMTTPDPAGVVPRADLEKVREELQSSQEQENTLKLKLDAITTDLEKVRGKLEDNQKLEQDIHDLELKEQDYQKQMQDLRQNLRFLSGKADEQALKAIEAIQGLEQEAQSARQQHEAVRDTAQTAAQEELKRLNTANVDLQEQIKAHLQKIGELQKDVESAQGPSDEEARWQDKEALDRLTANNDVLKTGVRQLVEKIGEVEQNFLQKQHGYEEELASAQRTIEELVAQRNQLKQEARSPEETAGLEKRLREVSRESEEKLALARERAERLESEIASLKGQIELYNRQIKELESNGSDKSRPSVAGAGRPARGADDALDMLERLKHINARLSERERVLSQELTKSRAESTGLKKLCEDFKMQIEQAS